MMLWNFLITALPTGSTYASLVLHRALLKKLDAAMKV